MVHLSKYENKRCLYAKRRGKIEIIFKVFEMAVLRADFNEEFYRKLLRWVMIKVEQSDFSRGI